MSNSARTDLAARRGVARAGILLSLPILGVAGYVLFRALRSVRMDQIAQALRVMSARQLWLCLLLTGASFLALGLYDVIAVRAVTPGRISVWRAWLAGAGANAISNTLGFHALTATAVRLRIYARRLSVGDIARATSLSWTGLIFGFLITLAFALLLAGDAPLWHRIGGASLLVFLALCAQWFGRGRSVRLGSFRLVLPTRGIAIAQMLVGGLEMASAIGALYVLLPAGGAPSFAAFACLYIGAVLLGIASHAPGGLGVFEAAILTWGRGQNHAEILAALMAYRLIYNFLPFTLAAAGLALWEIGRINSTADSAE